jgi:DNA-binding GntR family transcriptional regulator
MNARFVREAVEVAVAREAAEMRPEGLVARLRGLVAEQKVAAAEENGVAFLRLDEAFHRALAEAIGRGFAWSVLEGLKAQMDRVRYLSFEGATPLSAIIRQHVAIVDAIGAGDPVQAEAAMRAHLREILASLPRIAEAHPDYFEPAAAPGRTRQRKEEAP